ncbi:MAG: hypothetical protein KGL52_12905 [Rhodospirillales bacterium]|jgi:hypothetical protein|nr:hypothetical protein [Rhodospirillales bacterium]
MRYLPLSLSLGPELRQVMRAAAQDPRGRAFCGYCGGALRIPPSRPGQRVCCPGCWRWQEACVAEETPWRLSASAAAALRQTRRWLRR